MSTPRWSTPALLLLVAASAAAQGAAAPERPPLMADVLAASTPADWRPLDPENTLYLELPAGRVVIELAPAFAPRHVAGIKALARQGFYDGLAVVRVQDNYVAQWADPYEDDAQKRRVPKPPPAAPPAEFGVPWSEGLGFTPLPDRDGYAPEVGFAQGFPAARDLPGREAWLAHCYGALGVARGNEAASGDDTSLYVVIGHAPRHLDRNITVAGRVVQGIELLASLPRGPAPMGFLEKPEQMTPVKAVRVAADLPAAERSELELLRTDTATFARLVESRRNRREEWYKRPAGHVELCNVPLPVRPLQPPAAPAAKP